MKKIVLALYSILKSLFWHKKVSQKRVLEKINIDNKFKKKHLPANKKTIKAKKKGK